MNTDYLKTRAFCIKQRRYKENDGILTFFSEKMGIFTVFQRGFFRSFPFKPILDLGMEVDLVAKELNGKIFFKSAHLKKAFECFSYESLVLCSFLCELLSCLPEDDSIKVHYPFFFNNMRSIEENQSPHSKIVLFQMKIIQHLGIAGEMDICHSCQRPFDKDEEIFAQKGEWSFFCKSCLNRGYSLRLDSEERNLIEKWMEGNEYVKLSEKTTGMMQKHLASLYQDLFYLKTLPALISLFSL